MVLLWNCGTTGTGLIYYLKNKFYCGIYCGFTISVISFAGWSSNGGEFGVFRTDKYWIFDVQGGTPNKERRVQFEPQVPREWKTGLGSDKFSLCGSLCCPWQSSLLFYVGKSQKRLSSKHCISKTSLSAINTAR